MAHRFCRRFYQADHCSHCTLAHRALVSMVVGVTVLWVWVALQPKSCGLAVRGGNQDPLSVRLGRAVLRWLADAS